MANKHLVMKNISKSFNSIIALNDISLDIELGGFYGIVGENGAGKSVLMKILSGSMSYDSGKILIDDLELSLRHPVDAIKYGIVTIFQDVNLVADLTVAENLFLSKLPRKPITRRVDWRQIFTQAEILLRNLQFDIDPKTKISKLNYSQKRMVEIAKAIANKANILIVDEAYIGNSEYEQVNLLNILKGLNDDGVTIIYISHNLDEVINYCKDLIILKNGRLILQCHSSELSKEDIIRAVVGGVIRKNFPRIINENKRLLLKVNKAMTQRGINDISFNLYKGEILGVAGLIGSGRTAIARMLFGIDKLTSGSLEMNNTKFSLKSPVDAISHGIGYMPEDIMKESLHSDLSVSKNITMANIREISNAFIISRNKESLVSRSFIKRLQIKTASPQERITNLSQGNQQKVHLSKWVNANCNILILDEPTNGIDLATRVDIYNYMNNFTLKGRSIVLISSNLEELIGMCDRIMVLKEGKLASIINRKDFSKESIMNFATGFESHTKQS